MKPETLWRRLGRAARDRSFITSAVLVTFFTSDTWTTIFLQGLGAGQQRLARLEIGSVAAKVQTAVKGVRNECVEPDSCNDCG
jgi:hypothetical protein